MTPKLTAERLCRRALIYVRQSTPGQVIHNQESQRRQYSLAERARELGFQKIEVIDEDLGRSGSGLVERPGFQRLVAEVCSGEVGAVFSVEASRLARNGRDWHHLIELCGMVGAVVVDLDGIYDPGVLNDRLLLGLKGTMSEFELNLLRQRSAEAIAQKARRGEMQFNLPVGLCWTRSGKIEKDPDRRVQEAIQSVFDKLTQLGSCRQVLLWFRQEQVSLPVVKHESGEARVVWELPRYDRILHIVTNPLYAGAYAYGKTTSKVQVVKGRARKSYGHRKALPEWTVLLPDHHPGYISWEQFQSNQAMIQQNAHMESRMGPKSGRGGQALLAGLLRCRRCGHMLHVRYVTGRQGQIRYVCRGGHLSAGQEWCGVSFGGRQLDHAVGEEILRAIQPEALQAALDAAEQQWQQQQQRRQLLLRELEQTRYEARLAARRYEVVDPDNRLVAGELETRWNGALARVAEAEKKLQDIDSGAEQQVTPTKEMLLSLAEDLPSIWNAASTEMRLKQRIAHILIREVIADIQGTPRQNVLVIHWMGGRHSEIRFKRPVSGENGRKANPDIIEAVRQMATRYNDEQIAMTLNRLGLRTGTGNGWSAARVCSLRHYHGMPPYQASDSESSPLTLQQAAEQLGVSSTTVLRMIRKQRIEAKQVIPGGPWEIPAEAVNRCKAQQGGSSAPTTVHPLTPDTTGQEYLFSDV